MRASLTTQTSTSSGSSETEAKALAVIPCPNRSETAVTTVIPVVNMPTLSRNSRLVGSLGTALLGGDDTSS
jgi:hypothetical protein